MTQQNTRGPWQPIETAPKDGTPVLIICEKIEPDIGTPYKPNYPVKADFSYDSCSISDTDYYSMEVINPTHWMPHPYYGPCDALANGDCAECLKQSPRVPDDAKYHELCKQCWDALGITEYTGKHIAEHIKELQSPRVPVIEILDTVLEQAEDDGLWFNAKYASEAYLQQELRRLHAVIERAYAELSKTKQSFQAAPQKGV